MKSHGFFDDSQREYVVHDPATPCPWINYLGNGRFSAFLSQQAGGLAWFVEPQQRRLTRYYHLPAPGDRPGFYLYVREEDGTLWNPHFAPTRLPLDGFEARHGIGYTRFSSRRGGIAIELEFFVPPREDVLVWDLRVVNRGASQRSLTLASYVEFGLLDFQREAFWCYLKNHIGFTFEKEHSWIRYDYRVFEAPFAPAVFFASLEEPTGFDCSRDVFCGAGRGLENPEIPLAGSELPSGGHGCGCLGHLVVLQPGEERRLVYLLGAAEDWAAAKRLRGEFDLSKARRELDSVWEARTSVVRVKTGDEHFDRWLNGWAALNCRVALERCRDLSTDHTGLDGLRFRDTMQDALAVASFDPDFARERIRLVLASQASDGTGNFAFYPFAKPPRYVLTPRRSDNGVWPIFSVANLVRETGDVGFFKEKIPFRDGGEATVFEHIRRGLEDITRHTGPHGLPLLFHADWNDGLAVFRDERAESVMLGMQMVCALEMLAPFAVLLGEERVAEWCRAKATQYRDACNAEPVWDGEWYCRLLLSDGTRIGSRSRAEGRIYLEPQAWAVMSGVGDFEGRGRTAMASAYRLLDTARGLRICDPPYTGIPSPQDPMVGNAPGTGENGAIFCHANTWAVIADCLLGEADRAFSTLKKILSSVAAEEQGQEHWQREPYVFVSTVTGPARGADFGRGGISWLTGTASWMYVAATQYLLGLQPDLESLRFRPCWPSRLKDATVRRIWRGQVYEFRLSPEATIPD